MILTTISCDAVILRCESCRAEAAESPALVGGSCLACGEGSMQVDRICGESFSLRRDGTLIRCVVENKDGWRCDDRGGRDFCPKHVHLANPARVAQPDAQSNWRPVRLR